MIAQAAKYILLAAVVGFLLWGLTRGREVRIEVDENYGQQVAATRQVAISISHDDSILIDGRSAPFAELESRLAEATEDVGGSWEILITADPASSNTVLVAVMDASRRAGANNVAIASP